MPSRSARLFGPPAMLALALALALAAGCGQPGRAGEARPAPSAPAPVVVGTEAPTVPAPPPAASPPAASPPAARPPAATTGPAGVLTYRVTYGWAVPSHPVRVPHTVHPPIAPPPAPPLPYLTGISVGDHAGEHPGYARISFTFAGAFPEYTLQYVPEVRTEGRGDPLPLPGNGFLRIQFIQAQAHDEAGHSTVTGAPATRLDIGNLAGYGAAGDFEGRVTYGLGIRVAAGGDQALPIRVSELTRSAGAGKTAYVVAFDVQAG
ncbi:hypothetical protein GCM10023322_64770 [Rugosimonospora acidiphila]|uniref:AMIN-like domain-containing protein n=2 Tax=Rugosimonospora acidiphila TaxID=556531 RepID=A0ABP9SJP2_9ACTN